MTITREDIKDFTKRYGDVCRENDSVDKDLFMLLPAEV